MNHSESLQMDYELLTERTRAKRAELTEIQRELKDLANALVDSDAKTRPSLVQKRASLAADRDACTDEWAELGRRRNVAHLAIYQYALEQAQAKANEIDNLVRQKGGELNEALDERRHFYNGGRSRLPEPEGDNMAVALDVKIARLKVETANLEREAHRAGNALDRAKIELDEIRAGIDKAGIQSPN